MSGNSTLLILSTWLFIQLPVITEQLLTAEYLNVKLPVGNACPSPHYSGADSILLFGGCSSGTFSDILQFSISSETLEKVGTLPGEADRGTLQSDRNGNIFYFGGGPGFYTDVFKFDPGMNTTTKVTSLPYDVRNSISFKVNNTVFLLGGWDQAEDLAAFDMETLALSTLSTSLPFWVTKGTSVRVGNRAYIFDDTDGGGNKAALELNLDTYLLRPVGPSTLPVFQHYPDSVFTGDYAYVVGGYEPNSRVLTNGLIQFDAATFENKFIPVGNFPVGGSSFFFFPPASVFVQSNNRIYFFGGYSCTNYTIGECVTHDEIFYVDLTPLVEPSPSTSSTTIILDFFTCIDRPNGLYPHPEDWSLFIGCQNEEMTIFSCPSPLLFDPEGLLCDYPKL